MAESKKKYGLNDEFTFGKYKNWSIEDVIAEDPEYVVWAVRNIAWFDIDSDAVTAVSESYEFKTGQKLKTDGSETI